MIAPAVMPDVFVGAVVLRCLGYAVAGLTHNVVCHRGRQTGSLVAEVRGELLGMRRPRLRVP